MVAHLSWSVFYKNILTAVMFFWFRKWNNIGCSITVDILGCCKGRGSVTFCQPSWHPSWDRQAKLSLHNTKHLLAFLDCLLVLSSRSRGSNTGQSSPATTSGTMSVSTGLYLLACWNPEIPQCVSSNLIPILQRQDGVFFSVRVLDRNPCKRRKPFPVSGGGLWTQSFGLMPGVFLLLPGQGQNCLWCRHKPLVRPNPEVEC